MTQQFSFNLVDEPWLPCVWLDGTAVVLSLRDTLTQAHQLQTLTGDSPPQTAALHRFLLAVLHRVFGPADYDEWAELWQAEKFDIDRLNAYLDHWRHRFDLFDPERPFYQATDSRVKPKSTINLSHDRASGNNATLFDHHTEEIGEGLTPPQAARALITAQAFALAGLSGITQKFTDGTCAGGIIFLVEGDDLKQTFLLNMMMYPPDSEDMFPHHKQDKPAWEMDDSFEPDRPYTFGYLDYLTWQNRRILLQPEQIEGEVVVRKITMGPALRFEPTLRDPMKHYRLDDKLGALATSFSEDRVLWRDSATFFSFQDKADKFHPPTTFRWLRELVLTGKLDRYKRYRCIALGMSKKQAKVFFFREERLLLPLTYLMDETLVGKLADALDYTATIAFDLLQATRRVGMFLQVPDADNKKWGGLNPNAKTTINNWVAFTGVERHYWANLDIPFQSFIVDLAQKDREAILADWLKRLHDTALDAFDRAAEYAGTGPRSFKAVVRGRSYLNYRLNQLTPKKEEEMV